MNPDSRMYVGECSRCGASIRFLGDAHECGNRSRIEWNLSTTDEERRKVSDVVRRVYGISEEVWNRRKPLSVHR
jgi:hypothetical protein